MKKILFIILFCVWLFLYIIHWLLFPIAWIRDKITDFANKLDESLYSQDYLRGMEEFIAKNKKNKHGKNGIA